MLKQVLRVALSMLPLLSPAAYGARFLSLGTLPGGITSNPSGISADGTTVVGISHYLTTPQVSGYQGYRWTEATGMAFLGVGPGGSTPHDARAISGDGSTIVGMLESGAPYKWTQAGGIVSLAPRLAPPVAVSYNGATIVAGPNNRDVSGNGGVVVGSESSEGYRDVGGARTWLGDLPGGAYGSSAHAVSRDGSVVVGDSVGVLDVNGTPIQHGFAIRWSDAEGLVPLGPWIGATATDISAGKIVIVGYGAPTLTTESEPYRWTPATGMESIRELLLAESIDVTALGWKLINAVAVSANGRVIVGEGQIDGKLQTWLAELPVPGDFDADGDADGDDFLLWQRGLGTTYDADDLAQWRVNTTEVPGTLSTAAASIPEPRTAALFCCLTVAFGSTRRGARVRARH